MKLSKRTIMSTRGKKYECKAKVIPAMFKVVRTAVVLAPEWNPNLPTQEENNKTTKRRRTSNDETPDNLLASRFLSNATEDVLLEIFLRLPNSRSAIQCSSVCRGWLQLISQPQFIPRFIRMHRRDHCYTILFRKGFYHYGEYQKYYQVVCKLFSRESLLLHGNPPSSSNYLDFLPELMSVRASCNDLLLVSPDPRYNTPSSPNPKFYICNPVTKKWSLIPGDTPHGTRSGFALICHQDQYKVVIIYCPEYSETLGRGPHSNYNYQTKLVFFCAKSGQWSEFNFLFPMRDKRDYNFSLEVVTCNGILYWMDGNRYLDRIIALDLFGDQRGVLVYLPEPIRNKVANVMVRLAAVKKGGDDVLRLLHMFRAGGDDRKCFVVKIWELNHRDDDDNSWVLVHERNLNVPNADDNNVVSAAFHPKDCDVIFLICGMIVFEYRVLEDMCDKVGEIREPVGIECLDSFVLDHPAWPTVVPSF